MVAFSANKALLAAQASALAIEASAAGLTSLAAALDAFSSEIGGSVTEDEFFGGGTTTTSTTGTPPVTTTTSTKKDSAGLIWTQTLMAAAATIKAKIHNDIKTDVDTIKTSIGIIQDDISRIRDLGDREVDGAGFRTIQPYGEIGLAILWLLYIERGKILEFDLDDVKINELLSNDLNFTGNEQLRAASIERIRILISRLRGAFNAWDDI